jgi:hypothetical protein
MNQAIKKLSPFALGMTLFAYNAIQLPLAQAASLDLGANPAMVELPAAPTAAVGDCLASSTPTAETAPGEATAPDDRAFSGLNYQESNTDLAPNPPTVVGSESGAAAPESSTSTLIAQLAPDDCCEVGGTATCEVAGLPPQGGGLLAAPFLPLLAAPLGALAFIGGSDPNRPRPVPLSESSTAGLVAGFGLVGLWYSRRFRQDDAE